MNPGGALVFLLASLATLASANLRRGTGKPPSSTDQEQASKYLDFIYSNTRLTVISRVHGMSASHLADPRDVISFIRACDSYASSIIICVGVGDELEHADYIKTLRKAIDSESFRETLQIVLLPVVPWGKFTPALNAAVVKVAERGDGFIAFQSLEFRISNSAVRLLQDYMMHDDSVLVIGPRMQGHEFQASSKAPRQNVVLRGRTCPWNTFAIWRTKYLALTGFPIVADGMGGNMGGVEEVAAITLLQKINPTLQAVLAGIKGLTWETNFTDPKRKQWHEEKMRSKDERPAKQLQWLNFQGGAVVHVEFDLPSS